MLGKPKYNNGDKAGGFDWAIEQLSKESNTSECQVQRFIRLTELLPELLEM